MELVLVPVGTTALCRRRVAAGDDACGQRESRQGRQIPDIVPTGTGKRDRTFNRWLIATGSALSSLSGLRHWRLVADTIRSYRDFGMESVLVPVGTTALCRRRVAAGDDACGQREVPAGTTDSRYRPYRDW
jgi:hypothetical protein